MLSLQLDIIFSRECWLSIFSFKYNINEVIKILNKITFQFLINNKYSLSVQIAFSL